MKQYSGTGATPTDRHEAESFSPPIAIQSDARRLEGGIRLGPDQTCEVPLVSIVIVAYRDRAEVEALIENITPFRSKDLEVIIIDGASDDGTIESLYSNNSRINYWLCEPDNGIYDAMNKGVAAARGEYILHLNAGDRLSQLPLEVLRECLRDNIDVVSFRVLMDGKDVFIPRVGFKMRIDNCWHHQGTFYRRSKHLGYDTRYRICGDFDHNQRLMKANCSIRLLPQIVAEHQNNGISMHKSGRKEIYRSVRLHFGTAYIPIAFVRFGMNKMRWGIKRFFCE